MPFAYKLAYRLARLKHRTLAGAAAAVVAAALLSCELPKQVAAPSAPVSQLIIIPHTVTLQLNQDQDFVAVGLSAAGDTTPSTVSWDVTGGTITDMGASNGRHYGHYHGGTCGSFKVAATSHPDRTTDTATVTVAGCVAPVAAVTVSPAAPTVQVGQTAQLTATPRDANGTPLSGRAVTWASNNTAITVTAPTGQLAIGDSVQATVSTWVRNIAQPPADPATGTPPSVIGTQPAGARGVVDSGPVLNTTPGGDGAIRYHVLFAAAPSGWVVQDYLAKIVPTVPVAAVTVTPASVSVLQGQTVQLTATPRHANGNPLTGRVITWQSSNSAIATVNGSGLVSGVAAGGPVTMTATSEGQSGTASITVSGVPVASVTVSPASASVPAGQTQQLTATLRDANGNILTGRAVTWASNNTPVATVTGTGLVSAKVAGSATITATSEGQSGTSAITVTPVPVASVTVTPATAGVAVGSTVQLTATPKDANGNPLTGRIVTWQSSNNAIASVNGSGLVSGVAAGGPVTITATSEGQSGTAAVTVTTSTGAQFGHVFVVTEENTDYVDVTSSSMPYLTGLAAQYGLATQYYANTHPSIGNYFELATGQVLTNDDGSSTIENVPNIVRSLVGAGKTWKSYAEDIPNACYLGGDTGNYARKHNVFALLLDVANDPTGQACHIVPLP